MVRHVAFAAYCAACLLAVSAPWAFVVPQRVAPQVLGLPPSLAWSVLWALASFGALVAYELTRPGPDPGE